MAYINNQYIRLDKPLEELVKTRIKTDENNKLIEEIEIKEYKPNIIIAYGIDRKIDYCNICSSVRILITDRETLKGRIEEIPDFIEVVIVDNLIYYNVNERESNKEFDLLIFENNEDRFEMKVERLIEEGKINSYNKVGNTILNYLIMKKKEEKALKIIDLMEIESINEVNKDGKTALILACIKKMESVALKLLEREGININQIDNYGETALIWACMKRMESVALKLIEREKTNINQKDKNGETALIIACRNKMEVVALKLLEREDCHDPDGACRRIDHVLHGQSLCHVNPRKGGLTAFYWACSSKMETVALKIKKKEDLKMKQKLNLIKNVKN